MGPAEKQLREKHPKLFNSFMRGMFPGQLDLLILVLEEDRRLVYQYVEELDQKKVNKKLVTNHKEIMEPLDEKMVKALGVEPLILFIGVNLNGGHIICHLFFIYLFLIAITERNYISMCLWSAKYIFAYKLPRNHTLKLLYTII